MLLNWAVRPGDMHTRADVGAVKFTVCRIMRGEGECRLEAWAATVERRRDREYSSNPVMLDASDWLQMDDTDARIDAQAAMRAACEVAADTLTLLDMAVACTDGIRVAA